MTIKIQTLKRANHNDVKRFAAWLKLKHVDSMSHGQLCRLIYWLLTRREKRQRNLIP
jgi:hypothetical protein